MILPQDTKEPLVDSDTELDFDLDEDDFVPPYSPAPADHAPFLSQPDDIELCPPPYSDDSDVEAAWKRQPSLREQLQKRRTRILWSCLAIIALYTTFVTYFAAHHRRPRHPHHTPFAALGVGLADGSDCAVFPPGQPYPRRSDRTQRSSNATFLLPTNEGELFDQFRGDAVVGDIFVTAYDADSDVGDDGAVYHGVKPPQEYVRMTVEAVYDVDSADHDEGVGRDMLQASSVCLVRRPGPGRSHSNGLGVDLYAVRPEDIDHLPLHFRLHVQVPRAQAKSVESVERRSLPPLLLQGAAGRVDVSALSGVPLSTLRIRTLAGSIGVRDTTAENLQLHASSGSISGAVAVSQSLDVRTEAGKIDLDLSLASHARGKCGPVDASINTKAGNIDLRHGEWAPCRTLREAVVSGAGNVDIRAHPRFEGGFRLDTAMGKLEVEETDAPDPENRGRHRTIRKKESGGWGHQSIRGTVAWGDKLGKEGSQLKAETAVGKIKVAF